MGNFDVRVDYFFVPLATHYGWIANETQLSFAEYIKRPLLTLNPVTKSSETSFPLPGMSAYSYGPGSIFDQLDNPTIPQPHYVQTTYDDPESPGGIPHNANAFLAFWDVYRTYYLNPQEATFPVCSIQGSTAVAGVEVFDRRALDYLPRALRSATAARSTDDEPGQATPTRNNLFKDAIYLLSPDHTSMPATGSEAAAAILFINHFKGHFSSFDAGIPCATYSMDYFRGRISKENIFESKINTDDSVTINSIRFANKLQKLADKFDITSGRFSDWMRSIWSVRVTNSLTPQYLGGTSMSLGFKPIVQTNSSTKGETPLGWKVGYADSEKRARPVYFKSNTYGTLLGICTVRPRLVYNHINWPEDCHLAMGDLFTPDMANLGYQKLNQAELAPGTIWSNTGTFTPVDNTTLGYHLAWVEQMTDVDRCYGLFRPGYSLSEYLPNYTPTTTGKVNIDEGQWFAYGTPSYSTYVIPWVWNRFFADTSTTAHNFRVTIAADIKATRAIPYRTMPSL